MPLFLLFLFFPMRQKDPGLIDMRFSDFSTAADSLKRGGLQKALAEYFTGELQDESEAHMDITQIEGPPVRVLVFASQVVCVCWQLKGLKRRVSFLQMGFKLISTAKFLAGNDDVVVMVEKKLDNETVCVLTSTEVNCDFTRTHTHTTKVMQTCV
jgi:hypothetical protein